ncbi:DUF1304 family protein [Roseibium album]|uniref:DUF1304 family protein n=1 Tax=Roseibium album TaxID=311410 RepID=UPI0018C9EB1A|nr:DUF1304 family protein [Roseibium album]MBG6207806.1 putative membrane protein [Labrenzia sp. EL_126]
MTYLYWLLMLAVIGGHLFFAYGQWFKWPDLCEKLTDLTGEEIEKTAFLGRSFSSYNASVGVGLCLSFWLPVPAQAWVQGVVLALIVFTAAIGAQGTKGNSILVMRLVPAALALVFLILSGT